MRILILLFLTSGVLAGSDGEFTLHTNGLIYDEETMVMLRDLVARENRHFLACPPLRTYTSRPYILVDQVAFQGDMETLQGLMEEMRDAKSADSAAAAHADKVFWILKRMPLIQNTYQDGTNWFDGISGHAIEGEPFAQNNPLIRQESLYEFGLEEPLLFVNFHVEGPQSQVLGEYYSRMVNYVDCMVGATSIRSDSEAFVVPAPDSMGCSALEYFQAMVAYKGRPGSQEAATHDERKEIYEQYDMWDDLRMVWIHEVVAQQPDFLPRLEAAAKEAARFGGGASLLDSLVEAYLPGDMVLSYLRSMRVVGGCSQDQAPRIHAQKIASFAAETLEWDIFLRAHLNLLNDNFDRYSDGSYAWGRRYTYFQELEALNLDMTLLVPGLSMVVVDAEPDHYFGSPARLARGLQEAANPEPIVDQVLQMLEDPALDPPNKRSLITLVIGYLLSLDSDEARWQLDEMEQLFPKLPPYFKPLLKAYLD